MKFGDLLSLGDKGKNLSCVWKVGGGGGVGLGGENGEVEVFRYEDVPRYVRLTFLNCAQAALMTSPRQLLFHSNSGDALPERRCDGLAGLSSLVLDSRCIGLYRVLRGSGGTPLHPFSLACFGGTLIFFFGRPTTQRRMVELYWVWGVSFHRFDSG